MRKIASHNQTRAFNFCHEWCDSGPNSATESIANHFLERPSSCLISLYSTSFPPRYSPPVRFATMTGTYGTFSTPGSSSMAASDPSDAQDDAVPTHSGKRAAPAADQPHLARVSSRTDEDTLAEQDIGVTRIQALYRVFGSDKGKASIWLFYVSIGLISYAYSLSSNTVSNFFSFATSAFGKHSILGTVGVAIYVLGAVGACKSLDAESIFGSLWQQS